MAKPSEILNNPGRLVTLSTTAGPIEGNGVPYDSMSKWDESEITGYHFHTYFFQDYKSKSEALNFR